MSTNPVSSNNNNVIWSERINGIDMEELLYSFRGLWYYYVISFGSATVPKHATARWKSFISSNVMFCSLGSRSAVASVSIIGILLFLY